MEKRLAISTTAFLWLDKAWSMRWQVMADVIRKPSTLGSSPMLSWESIGIHSSVPSALASHQPSLVPLPALWLLDPQPLVWPILGVSNRHQNMRCKSRPLLPNEVLPSPRLSSFTETLDGVTCISTDEGQNRSFGSTYRCSQV